MRTPISRQTGPVEDATDAPRASFQDWIAYHLEWENLFRFGMVAFQFGLCVLLLRAFSLETKALLEVSVLIWCGFVVHHLLPMRLRLPFFGLLSISSICLIFGVADAVWMVAIGGSLIGLAHLPAPMKIRVMLILIVGAVLAYLRAGFAEAPWSVGVWPILGAMFMFRLIVYLYDLSNSAAPFSFWRAIGYFFMVPNVCFPMFPVVDYKSFTRTYYDQKDEFAIYQTGVQWILRGIVHLILYRMVYQNVLVDPATAETAASSLQNIVGTYLLYLKISGTFHLIVGMLHLFGFNLAETHHNYLLAHSFTDYWRRVNIYWKDFVQKLFFNPVYFRLSRRWGTTGALVMATMYAFTLTWLLHSYQWFWIRGTFPVIWQDGVFWYFLAFLVLVNMIWEMKRGRKRRLKTAVRTLTGDALLGLQTIATFVVISLSWTVWTSESWGELVSMMQLLGRITPREVAVLVAGLLGLGFFAIIMARTSREEIDLGGLAREKRGGPMMFWRSSAVVVAVAGLLLVIEAYPLTLSFSPTLVALVQRSADRDRLNVRDQKALERGYYEDLTDLTRFNSKLATLYNEQPPEWEHNAAIDHVDGFPSYRFKPNQDVIFKGARLQTNRWGMRDRDYEKETPPGTFRIAILGASHTMGAGVANDENYESLVEERLNDGYVDSGRERIEILNFAVGGYGPITRLAILKDRVLQFEPDMVIYVAIDDLQWVRNEISFFADNDIGVPFPYVVETARRAGIEKGVAKAIAEKRLAPYQEDLLHFVYERFLEITREHGIRTFATVLPQPEVPDGRERDQIARSKKLAQEAGFTMFDTSTAYATASDLKSLWLAKWDRHPNARGHRLLAAAVYDGLLMHLPSGDEAVEVGQR